MVVSFTVFGISEGWLSHNPFINTYIVCLALFAATLTARQTPVSRLTTP